MNNVLTILINPFRGGFDMTIEERIALRKNILESLYNHYFNNSGRPATSPREEIDNNPDEFLAYRYLADKGLIEMKNQGVVAYLFSITVRGIDTIESEKQNSN